LSSYFGSSRPGAVESFDCFEDACGPGNGVAFGIAGTANTPRVAEATLAGAAGASDDAVVSTTGFAVLSSFCCAKAGNADSAATAANAYHLRINILHENPMIAFIVYVPAAPAPAERCAPLAMAQIVPWPFPAQLQSLRNALLVVHRANFMEKSKRGAISLCQPANPPQALRSLRGPSAQRPQSKSC
jgi:hypothetical protein